MKQKSSHAHDTVRLTIDFPADQHKYIKMLAAKESISLRQFVMEHLPSLDKCKKRQSIVEHDEFDDLLKELLVEKSDLLRKATRK